VLLGRNELEWFWVLPEIIGEIRCWMRGRFAEYYAACGTLNDREPFRDCLPKAGSVIEVMVADDQLRDWLARRERAGVVDHRLGLAPGVNT
jgi:hypothetical protein